VSYYEKMWAAQKPPTEGDIRVLSVTTAASAIQDTGVEAGAAGGPRTVKFIGSVAFYVTFAGNGGNTVTDPDGTATTGDGRTWLVPANTEWCEPVSPRERYFKVRGTGSGTVRWRISSR